MYHFCTYFDNNYLPRALCLLDSLEQYCLSFKLYTLCLDVDCFEQVKRLGRPQLVPICIQELEAAVPELITVKNDRTPIEYYFTCGPAFLCYLMEHYPAIDVITYLDADLYFLSTPEPLFELFKGYSIGVIPHHMPEYRKNIRFGNYNVGWITFRHDADGLACLHWWRDRCIEWCYDRIEDGKYADQYYLDDWPKLFNGVYEFTHHGANVGAWNVQDYHFSLRDSQVYADNDPVIFYHFHNFKKITKYIYKTGLELSMKFPNPILKKYVFKNYIEHLERSSKGLNLTTSIRKIQTKFYIIKTIARIILGLLFRQYILVLDGRVF
jgi:hypothetical protein